MFRFDSLIIVLDLGLGLDLVLALRISLVLAFTKHNFGHMLLIFLKVVTIFGKFIAQLNYLCLHLRYSWGSELLLAITALLSCRVVNFRIFGSWR